MNQLYDLYRSKNKPLLILLFSLFLLPQLIAQPNNINVSGCGTTVFNGNYEKVAGICGCDKYQKIGAPTIIVHRDNAGFNIWIGSSSGENCSVAPYVLRSGVTDCDPTSGLGTAVDGCSINSGLPVELIHFSAETNTNSVRLHWETATEINNEGFDIERSLDGRNFQNIAFISGNGTTSQNINYQYDDLTVRKGQLYYYRLRQVDFDGQFDYSAIVSVHLKSEQSTLGDFFPNPSEGTTSIDLVAAKNVNCKINVFDLSGRPIHFESHQLDKGLQRINFDFSKLDAGLYVIEVVFGTEFFRKKLILQ